MHDPGHVPHHRAPTEPNGAPPRIAPPQPGSSSGSRARGPVLVGLSLVCTLLVAATVLTVAQRLSPPAAEPATTASSPGETTEPERTGDPTPTTSSDAPVEYADFDDDGVVMRYPEKWAIWHIIVEKDEEYAEVLSKYEFYSRGAYHWISFTVFSLEGVPPGTAREYQQSVEADIFMGQSNISDWRRIGPEEEPSTVPGWDTSLLEVTYHDSDRTRPDRWMLWRYAVAPEEGIGYDLQFDVPASEQEEYAPVVEEVFDSFALVLCGVHATDDRCVPAG